jgi:HlyD family secretion protein
VPNGALVSPQDIGPAALALGLDPASLDMSQFMGRRGGRPGAAAAAAPDEAAEGGGASSPRADGAGARGDLAAELQARVQSGELTPDSVRALIRARREAAAEADGTVPSRRSVVFVMNAQGQPEPRVIEVGLSDWDNTQVISGLQGDEVLAVVGAAQLQAQQAQWLERIRSRSGGSPFGGGRR